MACLRRPLPTAFRINCAGPLSEHILTRLCNYFVPLLREVQINGEFVPPPQHMPWYPQQMGWKFVLERAKVRTESRMKEFFEFLKMETARVAYDCLSVNVCACLHVYVCVQISRHCMQRHIAKLFHFVNRKRAFTLGFK